MVYFLWNLTYLPLIKWLIILSDIVDRESPTLYRSYFSRILKRTVLIYIIAICWPIQFLGPLIKGKNAGELYICLLLNLSGLNSLGSSQYLGLSMGPPVRYDTYNPLKKWIPPQSKGFTTFLGKERLIVDLYLLT